jgi:hypothetical protein
MGNVMLNEKIMNYLLECVFRITVPKNGEVTPLKSSRKLISWPRYKFVTSWLQNRIPNTLPFQLHKKKTGRKFSVNYKQENETVKKY